MKIVMEQFLQGEKLFVPTLEWVFHSLFYVFGLRIHDSVERKWLVVPPRGQETNLTLGRQLKKGRWSWHWQICYLLHFFNLLDHLKSSGKQPYFAK